MLKSPRNVTWLGHSRVRGRRNYFFTVWFCENSMFLRFDLSPEILQIFYKYIHYLTYRNERKLKHRKKQMSIEERVKKIIVEQLGVKEEDVKSEASFVEDLGADSLDTVELVMALEEEFDIEIPDEEAEKITTVQSAIDYVQNNQ